MLEEIACASHITENHDHAHHMCIFVKFNTLINCDNHDNWRA